MTAEALHICGSSAAGALLVGLRSGRKAILSQGDELSFGPLAPLRSPEHWWQMRQTFWSDRVAFPSEEFPSARSGTLIGNIARLLTAETITLWLAPGLPEQLLSIWFLGLAERIGLDPAKLRVVDVARGPSAHRGVFSVGELEPERIWAHPPGQPLSDTALAEIKEAWAAVTGPDPVRLQALLAANLVERPELHRALLTLPARFPDRRTGLGRWEEALLRSVAARGPVVRDVLDEVYGQAKDPDRPYLYDLVGRLHRMAAPRSRSPALTIALPANPRVPYEIRVAPDGAEIVDPPFDSEVRLTPLGEAVLAGRHNLVELNGIDEWVGGIHLDSAAGRVWYRSGDSLALEPA